MGDDSPDISSGDTGGDTGTTTNYGDASSSDTGSPPPADTPAPAPSTDNSQFYTGVSPMASSFTDQNLPAALEAAGNVAGIQIPTDANAGQPPGTDNSSATAASSNNPQAGITQAAAQSPGAAPANAPQPESLVSKIGGGLLALAKSPGGGTILGNVLQGMAAGKAQEAAIAEHRRYTAPFTSDQFSALMNGTQTPIPMGYLERARRVGQFLRGGAQPTIGAPTAAPPARFGG